MTRFIVSLGALCALLFGSYGCDFGASSYEFVDARDEAQANASGGSAQGGSSGQGGAKSDGSQNALNLPPEDCSNGKDDDGDGAVDGDDTECETCAPAAPEGWIGPAHVYVGPGDKEPACGYVLFLGGEQPVADDVSCSDCACTKTGTGSCSLPLKNFNAGPNSGCSSLAWSDDVTTDCVAMTGSGYFKLGEYQLSGLGCAASGGEVVNRPKPNFETVILGCEAPAQQGSCAAGEIARPDVPAGYRAKLCVAQEADVAECPEEYPERSFFAQEISDDRGCSECSCGNDFACSATLRSFNQSDCTGGYTESFTVSSADCYETTGVSPDKSARLVNPNFTGSCQPSTTSLQGGLSEDGAVTVCCR